MSVIGRTRTTTGILETIVQELPALQIVNSSTATIWCSIPLAEGYDIVLDVKATGKSTTTTDKLYSHFEASAGRAVGGNATLYWQQDPVGVNTWTGQSGRPKVYVAANVTTQTLDIIVESRNDETLNYIGKITIDKRS